MNPPSEIEKFDMVEDENGNVNFIEKAPISNPNADSENLADTLPLYCIQNIGNKLLELIEQDKTSSEEWRTKTQIGLRELGFVNRNTDAKAPFSCFSGAYKQLFISFVANAVSELLPSKGYVDTKIIGKDLPDIETVALREKSFLNLYLMDIYKEYEDEVRKAVSWATVAGSAWHIVEQDPLVTYAKPIVTTVEPQDFIIDANAKSLQKAARKTISFSCDKREIEQFQKIGYYKDVDLREEFSNTTDKVTNFKDKIQGVQKNQVENTYNPSFDLYKCYVYLKLSDFDPNLDNDFKPYIVILEKETGKILRIEQNWLENSETFEEKSSFIQFNFLPGFGIYGIGLAHIASNDAYNVSEMKSVLLEGARLASKPGGFIMKGVKSDDSEIEIESGRFKRLDTQGLPIDQAFISPPFREPSPVLKALSDETEQNISTLGSITMQQIADFNSNAPASTTIALIEQSQKLQSSIIKNMHRALGFEFTAIHAIFAHYLKDETYPFELGFDNDPNQPPLIMKNDFSLPIKIIPVSDPNNSSSFLRIVKAEQLVNIAMQHPNLVNEYEALYRYLTVLGVPDVDKLIKNPEIMMKEAQENAISSDPITENIALLNGAEIQVSLPQDDEAHMAVHQNFVAQLDPALYAMQIQKLKQHISEHEKQKYLKIAANEFQIPVEQVLQSPPSPDIDNAIAHQAAEAIMQQQQQMSEQPTPIDPAQVMLEDVEVKRQMSEARAKWEHEKNQIEIEKAKLQAEMDKLKLQTELQKAEMKMAIDQEKLRLDAIKAMETKIDLNELDEAENDIPNT
jgi:hypothetical protein